MNKTEQEVYTFYTSLHIIRPEQLNIEKISLLINVNLNYWEFESAAYHYKGKNMIFLNENLTSRQQWQEFGHEVCHILYHAGRQGHFPISFLQLQEKQAEYFSYHFCVPTFMLQELKGVSIYEVMNRFNVEFDFALKRLEMYKNKFYERGINHGEFSKKRKNMAIRC